MMNRSKEERIKRGIQKTISLFTLAVYFTVTMHVPVLATNVDGRISVSDYGTEARSKTYADDVTVQSDIDNWDAVEVISQGTESVSLKFEKGVTVAGTQANSSVTGAIVSTTSQNGTPEASLSVKNNLEVSVNNNGGNQIDTGLHLSTVSNNGGTAKADIGGDLVISGADPDPNAHAVNVLGINGISIGTIENQVKIGGNVIVTSGTITHGIDNSTEGSSTMNTTVGGKVDVKGSRSVYGVRMSVKSGGNNNTIEVGKGVYATSESTDPRFTIRGLDVMFNGDPNDLTASTEEINIKNNGITAKGPQGQNTRGISVTGHDSDPASSVKINVKGDVTSDGVGVSIEQVSHNRVDIVIDGTISSGDGSPAILIDNSVNKDNISVAAWKIETVNEETPLFGKTTGTGIDTGNEAVAAVKNIVHYLIHIEQPDVQGAGTVLSTDKRVADEGDNVYVRIDVPEGYRLVGAYSDAEKKTSLLQDQNGDYYLVVPRGGGVTVNADIQLIEDDPDDPDHPVNPVNPEDPVDDNATSSDQEHYITDQNNAILADYVDIIGQINALLAQNPLLDVLDLQFGKHISLSLNEIKTLCEQQSHLTKRCRFEYEGRKYVMIIPPIVADENYQNSLAVLAAEPGGEAGFIRIAQIFGFALVEE